MKKKLASVLLTLGILLIIGGLCFTVFLTLSQENEKNKNIENTILADYNTFRTMTETFDNFRINDYYNEVTSNLFIESVEENYENWQDVLERYTSVIDDIDQKSSNLKKYCINQYYSNEDIVSKCSAFVIAYETAINYYVKDINAFNQNITNYLASDENARDNIKEYELNYDFVDINYDGNFYGKD